MTANKLTPRSVSSITNALREFGYLGLERSEVERLGNAALAGKPPEEGEVIDLFIRRMLDEAGLLPTPSE